MSRRNWLAGGLLAGLYIGCRTAAPTSTGSGARELALTFFQAIVGNDLTAAYAALDEDSRIRVPAGRFASLATAYIDGIGFVPRSAQVTACEEQGDRAIAHVVLTGRTAAHQRYKDVATLRRNADTWGVVLASNFGQKKRR
jgi:hypothetical protein